MIRKSFLLTALLVSGDLLADTASAAGNDNTRSSGYATVADSFSARQGKANWLRKASCNNGERSCADCHTADPGMSGKHVRTGKAIEPMAPSVNPQRLTDQNKVEKWFKRNCKWTWGRECSEQEKTDFISYLNSL